MSGVDVRPVPFAPGYEASSDGRVFSTKYGDRREIKPWVEEHGYRRVALRVDGVTRKVWLQRLLCLVFHGSPPTPSHEVRHVNGDPSVNRIDNLEWGTHAENMQDMVRHGRASKAEHLRGLRTKENAPRGSAAGGARLTEEVVVELRRRIDAGETVVSLAAELGVNKYTIYRMKWGKTWSHV